MIPTDIAVCVCFVLASSWKRVCVPQKYLSNLLPSTCRQTTEKFELLVVIQAYTRIKLMSPGNYIGGTEHLHVRMIPCLQ